MAKRASRQSVDGEGGIALSDRQQKIVDAIYARGLSKLSKEQREQLELYGPIYLAAVPKGLYCKAANRQSKQLLEQQERYELPYGDKGVRFVDVRKVVHWLHDFLARNGRQLTSKRSAEEEAMALASREQQREMAEECLRQKRLANLDKELSIKARLNEYIPRQPVEEFWGDAAGLMQQAINEFRGGGKVAASEVLERLNEMLDDIEQLAEEKFGGSESAA